MRRRDAAACCAPELGALARAPLQLPGLGQLLQGAAAARAPRDPLRAPRAGRRRPLHRAEVLGRAEPGAARADAGARRRPPARGVQRDHLVPRRRDERTCRRTRSSGRRCCSGCSSSSTPTSRTSPWCASGWPSPASRRREAEVAGEARGGLRGTRRDGGRAARRATFLVGERYTIADIALYAYTHVAHEGGFDLGPYPAIRVVAGARRPPSPGTCRSRPEAAPPPRGAAAPERKDPGVGLGLFDRGSPIGVGRHDYLQRTTRGVAGMRSIRTTALALVAVFALAAAAAASASAAEPTYMTCAKASKVGKAYTGKYSDKLCSTESATSTGKYERVALSGPIAFKAKGGEATLTLYNPLESKVEQRCCSRASRWRPRARHSATLRRRKMLMEPGALRRRRSWRCALC